MHLAVTTLCSAGDHVVASRSIYGGTHNLLAYTLPRFGIATTFVDPRDPARSRQRFARIPDWSSAKRWATPGSKC